MIKEEKKSFQLLSGKRFINKFCKFVNIRHITTILKIFLKNKNVAKFSKNIIVKTT